MKLWTSEHVFQHPWETVAKAAWRKYPNPMNPNVTGIDVLNRTVDARGTLNTHRLLITKWNLPGWVQQMLGMESTCYGSEVSHVDPSKKTFELRTTNLTLHNYISVDEKLVYTPHPDNEQHTLLKQEAYITIRNVPLSGYLEGVVEGTINSNAGKGRQAMEWVISKIKAEMNDLTLAAQRELDDLTLVAQREFSDLTLAAQRELVCVSKAMDSLKILNTEKDAS